MIKTIATFLIMALTVAFWGSMAVAQSEPSASGDNAALSSLLDVLKDDTARAALIEELEQATNAPSDADTPAPDIAQTAKTVGTQLAEFTKQTLEGFTARGEEAWTSLRNIGNVFDGLSGDEIQVVWDVGQDLIVSIIVTIGVYWFLRALAVPYFRQLERRLQDAGLRKRVGLFLLGNAFDLSIVIFAWALGYLIAFFVVGTAGVISVEQSLYLNAFIVVGVVKVALRIVLSPNIPSLRLISLSDRAARRAQRILSWVVNLVGYGQLLVRPIIASNVNGAAATAVAAIFAILALLVLVTAVLLYRRDVALWLSDALAPPTPAAQTDQLDLLDDTPAQNLQKTGFVGVLVQNWHWIVLVYLAYLFVISTTRPTEDVIAAVLTSVKIVAVFVVGGLLSGVLARNMRDGIALPGHVHEKLPLLQNRLNKFVPRIFLVLRFFLLSILAIFALNVLGVVDVSGWLESQFGRQMTAAIVSVSLILGVAFLIWLTMTSWVDYKLSEHSGKIPTARAITLLSLLRSAVTIAIIVLTVMFCLSELGLDIGPLIASAGVFGLALGFGAQKMVQDIITGVFIQFENAINVGDVITVGGTTGAVERLSVRSVSLRDLHGVFHIIPFSSVDMVSNYTRDFSFFVCDMGVAYREQVEDVKDAMFAAFDKLKNASGNASVILADLEWLGLNSFGDSAIVLRSRIKTVPGEQWRIGRAFNEIVKDEFDQRGIEIPFPYRTLSFAETKDGATQPIQIDANAAEQDQPTKQDQPKGQDS